MIKPTDASSPIEVCDFLSRERLIIHVKDKTSSSRLSHLFSQGTVSARVLKIDGASRDRIRAKIEKAQAETGQTGYEAIIPASTDEFQPAEFVIVYAVLGTGGEARLPFFSLVSLRQAVKELEALGYKSAFAWIEKPPASSADKPKEVGKKVTTMASAA